MFNNVRSISRLNVRSIKRTKHRNPFSIKTPSENFVAFLLVKRFYSSKSCALCKGLQHSWYYKILTRRNTKFCTLESALVVDTRPNQIHHRQSHSYAIKTEYKGIRLFSPRAYRKNQRKQKPSETVKLIRNLKPN